VLGVETDYDTVKTLTRMKSAGVSERGIVRALKGLELLYTEYTTHETSNGWRWILKWSKTTPLIVCLDQNSHWSLVGGRVGDKVILVDSLPKLKQGENGVHPMNRDDFLKRWKYRVCYGIRVGR
jgi:hypothetical protein